MLDSQVSYPMLSTVGFTIIIWNASDNIYVAVYGANGRVDVLFLKSVQKVLRSMARLAPELEQSFGFDSNSSGSINRVTATLNLWYHQVRFEPYPLE